MITRPTTKNAAHTRTEADIRDLSELIAALDRRIPQVERLGEVSIAHAAAELKAEAIKRIVDLERNRLQ